jgi:hypothetical protein
MTERKWEQCKTCHFCVEMKSHPCSDGLKCDNSIGHACVVALVMDDRFIHPNWKPNSIQCELWLEKDSIKITFKEIKQESTNDPIRHLFHKLWTKDVGTIGYDKKDWNELRDLLKERNIIV